MLLRLELAGVVGSVDSNFIPDIASTFFQITLATGATGQQWLQEAVALLPDQCAQPSERQRFLQAVAQSCQVDATSHAQMEQSVWCAAAFLYPPTVGVLDSWPFGVRQKCPGVLEAQPFGVSQSAPGKTL